MLNLRHTIGIGTAATFFGSLLWAGAQDDSARLKDLPITTAQGKAGELLRQWWKEGSAAGNAGDWYDNRDGAHSDLNLGPYPQLQRIVYADEQIRQKKHWAAQQVLLPKVVFGNSSTSAPPTMGGSNPRSYYTLPVGLAFLHEQYRMNNLYIYPEHRDHDPGHNGLAPPSPPGKAAGGEGGYGDLYPTNTPYLIISQGSSGSDQPFMRALPLTLAAFRPEVKRKLIDEKMLMPTVQWLLRTTNKHLKDPKEYLTGKAHPSVFEGTWVDELALVQKAHALTLEALPPLVQLKVLKEDQPQFGRDMFDPGLTEKLADTPGVIARIFRGKDRQRKLLVSAAGSFDVNKAPLTFTWVVLRGDAEKIRITPRDKPGAEAEIVVPYHARRPIAPGSPMESNRVDIGVFAHNGTYYSPPAFITFYSLDNEQRQYDDQGKVVSIDYGVKNFVDRRLTYPKEWRDAYRYDAKGRLLGWNRREGKIETEFSASGLIVMEKDKLDRCTKGRTVAYRQEPSKAKGPNPNALRAVPQDEVWKMAYADDEDFVGRATAKDSIPINQK